MKTSIDVPDDLYRKVKSKSALEGRAVRDVAIALFADWVGASHDPSSANTGSTSVPSSNSEGSADAAPGWLSRWEALGEQLHRASAGSAGYVAQLNTDRR